MLPPPLKQLVQITRGNEDTAGPLAQEGGTLGTRGDPWRKRTGPIAQEDEAGGLFSPLYQFFFAPWHASAFVPCLPEDFFGSPLEEAGGGGCRSPEPRLQLGGRTKGGKRNSAPGERGEEKVEGLPGLALCGQPPRTNWERNSQKVEIAGGEKGRSGLRGPVGFKHPPGWFPNIDRVFLLCLLKPWCEITGGKLQEEQSWRLGAAPLPAPCCRD